MNNQRRAKLKKAISKIETGSAVLDSINTSVMARLLDEAMDILTDVQNDEQDCFDNMPENLQGSMRVMQSEECIDLMEDAIDIIQTAIDELESLETFDDDSKELIDNCVDAISEVIYA